MRAPSLVFLIWTLAFSRCKQDDGRFDVSLVDPAPYFSIVQSDSVEFQEMKTHGRVYWNIKSGPWNAQLFVYRVGGVKTERDFRAYATVKNRMFVEEARDWLAELENAQKILFPEPEVITSIYNRDDYREALAMILVRLASEILTQTKLIRLYQFQRETISLELLVRGYGEQTFDVNGANRMIGVKRPPVPLNTKATE